VILGNHAVIASLHFVKLRLTGAGNGEVVVVVVVVENWLIFIFFFKINFFYQKIFNYLF